MLISVIVPTCLRPELLTRCLQRLAPRGQSLESGAYEVIVTDDSANAATRDLVAKDFPWARWMTGPRRGPAANRNHGARHAGGEWLAFVDDDCEPDRRWLESIADAIPHGELDVIEGKTICPGKEDNPFQEQVENLRGDLFWSCNLAVRSKTFEQLGGFDEDFAEAGGEDMEFAWRIRRHQLRACFAEKAIVVHPPRRLGWRKLWWRTWMTRWMLLYWIKTEQSPPLEAGPLPVCWKLLSRHLMDLVRGSSHLILRFDRKSWRRSLWSSCWKWLMLPVLLPCLLVWEFRFRRILLRRSRPVAKLHSVHRSGTTMTGRPTSAIRLSVALVTRNRPASLERCLQSWRNQSVAPFELVVSDDSDDSCRPAIEQLTRAHGGIYVPGPRRGLYANRNQATSHCHGTHILSADDDHTHPEDYLEKILRVVAADPARIWIFGERHPGEPDTPLACPPELGRSGFGCAPRNPEDCAAIADGATVYPRQVFDGGLRYDETYSFGGMWYLWGRWLVKNGWRISFSDATFVWHHVKEKPEGSLAQWRQQLAAACYVQFVRSLWLESSFSLFVWSCLCSLKRVCCAPSRLKLSEALAALRKAIQAQSLYSSNRSRIVSRRPPATKFRDRSVRFS